MTSNIAPSPMVASASSIRSTDYDAWKAFNHTVTGVSNDWMAVQNTTTGWLKIDFGSGNATAVDGYTVSVCTTGGYGTACPKNWTFQGSNNDTDWTTLDTRANQTAWSDLEMRAYAFFNSTAYRYYRLNITSNDGSASWLLVGELELTKSETSVEVISGPLAAVTALSAKPERQIVALPLAAMAGMDISDIFVGRFIAAEPLAAAAALTAKLDLAFVAAPLAANAAISANVTIAIPVTPLSASAVMTVHDVYIGRFIVAEPLTAQTGISASMRMLLASPALTSQAALSGGISAQLPAPALAVAAGLSTASAAVFINRDYQITYTCVLSLAGLADLAIPMSSFQARFKSGDPSFLSVVTPGMDLALDIADRAGGLLRVYMVKTFSDGNQIREMLGEVTNDDIRTDEGTENQSVTLDGHKTVTFTPKALALSGPQYRAAYGGGVRYRCTPDFYLRPGDTVTINEETFQANVISWAISVESELMEVSEL
jgi:hypothetical protein